MNIGFNKNFKIQGFLSLKSCETVSYHIFRSFHMRILKDYFSF